MGYDLFNTHTLFLPVAAARRHGGGGAFSLSLRKTPLGSDHHVLPEVPMQPCNVSLVPQDNITKSIQHDRFIIPKDSNRGRWSSCFSFPLIQHNTLVSNWNDQDKSSDILQFNHSHLS